MRNPFTRRPRTDHDPEYLALVLRERDEARTDRDRLAQVVGIVVDLSSDPWCFDPAKVARAAAILEGQCEDDATDPVLPWKSHNVHAVALEELTRRHREVTDRVDETRAYLADVLEARREFQAWDVALDATRLLAGEPTEAATGEVAA